MKITAEPRSDQWNADDFQGGPRTFTIAGVKTGAAEQKYDIEMVEGGGRVWRPPLTMLRVLIRAWGDTSADWQGRRVTLYLDPSVRFGPDTVGGIRISHISHIDKPLAMPLTASRGKRKNFTVQPLREAAPAAQSGPPTVPADVLANVAKALEAGTLADYLEYASTNNAPAHIIDHIKNAIKEQ